MRMTSPGRRERGVLEEGLERQHRELKASIRLVDDPAGEGDGLWTEYVQMREKKKCDTLVDVPGCCFVFHSVALRQPQTHPQTEQEESFVHLPPVGRQHRPADHDPHVAQLPGGLHQQLPLQLGSLQLLRTPLCGGHQVPQTHTLRADFCCLASLKEKVLLFLFRMFLG